MTSTRLPGKVMADLAGKPALERMIDRVRRAEEIDSVVVATTGNATDDPVAELSHKLGVGLHRGDEHDVLGRFYDAACQTSGCAFIRLTADCPMMDPGVIDDAVMLYRGGHYDYVSNVRRRTYPDGLDLEVFSQAALESAYRNSDHPYQREHVTPYMHGLNDECSHGNFNLGDLVFEADFSHVRWTVDYPADLERMRAYFANLPDGFTWIQALALATREPTLLSCGVEVGNQ